MTSNGEALTSLFFTACHKHAPKRSADWVRLDKDVLFERVKAQLTDYFQGQRTRFDGIELCLDGTEFQQRVWKQLLQVPYGETKSYQDIAELVGRPRACRAVGAANGRNPVSIIVPCHRVVGQNGSLTGYGGGLDNKQWLLNHEAKHQDYKPNKRRKP